MILPDFMIRELCLSQQGELERPLLRPYHEGCQDGVISFGVTHAGYDLRLGHQYLIFKNVDNTLVDPKMMKEDVNYASRFLESRAARHDGDIITVPPNSYILGFSLEYIRMPRWLSGTCVGKSTYARCGIIVNTTPLEPGWEGHLTIEIANTCPCPVGLFAGEGIAQLRFERLLAEPKLDYGQKGGKYQNQPAEPVPARVK